MPTSGGSALNATSLLSLIYWVEKFKPHTILELGSGTSSVWLGNTVKSQGFGRLVSIDHKQKFAEKTRKHVSAHGLERYVEVREAALEDTGLQKWYDHKCFDDLTEIDLLIIDGPPGTVGRDSRYPAIPKLQNQLARGAVIVLDDANRPDEKDVLDRWQLEYPSLTQIEESLDGALVALSISEDPSG